MNAPPPSQPTSPPARPPAWRAWLDDLQRDPWRTAAGILAWSTIGVMIAVVMGPWLKDLSTFGFHDWDVQTSHRELVRTSILRYGEFPAWNPYACGGFPAWGYVEAGTIVVSPFLPAYLVLPMSIALRVEVAGMALAGAAGAYFLASRFTVSHAARALVVVLWAVNGRWALQTAAGHTWHLAYAWMPWCFYFFERARARDRRVRDLAGGAVAIALLVYSGGIYPLPHTVLALGVYAAMLAILERSLRPLTTLASMGLLGVGLSAPKLLPLFDGFGKAPRLIDSKESLEPGALVALLTSRDQAFYSRPGRVSPYGWHEWGMYISTTGALVLVAAVIFVQGRRETALKAVGVLLFVLGFGAFHPEAPWTLLHTHVPVFRSQHVPSRFLYPAVLMFGLVAAAGIGRALTRHRDRRPWLDLAAGLLVLALAVDIARVAQKPMTGSMWMVPPDKIPKGRAFHFEQEPPFHYKRRDWAGPMYLAMLGNTGVINCYGAPPFERKGALPVTAPGYRGEAYLVGGETTAGGKTGDPAAKAKGSARVVKWTPNSAVLEIDDAEEGALVVYNMNFDDGWKADTGRVVPWNNAVATRVPAGRSRVTLTYRPPYLRAGLLLGALTVLALVALRRREQEAAA